MATLKNLCLTLHECTEKLEQDIKYNLNDLQNLITSNTLSETKIALERAKDYHYKEIMTAVDEILKNIKIILFHEDKIRWLDEEGNFTNEFKRYSYVKRQVYAFSQTATEADASTNKKRDKRRTASEVSIGTLEAWEKYLDKKQNEKTAAEERVVEVQKIVPKRTQSNARRRKKFVSSTLGAFLEEDGRKRDLDSILEDASSVEENERLSFGDSLENLEDITCNSKINTDIIIHNDKIVVKDRDLKVDDVGDEISNEALRLSIGSIENNIVEERSQERVKPKIVDVIYKKNPS